MRQRKKIVLVGGGGHCKVIIDSIRKSNEFEILGVVDENPVLKIVLGIKVVGRDKDLVDIFKNGCKNAFINIGSIGDVSIRAKLAEVLREIGFYLPVIKHPSSVLAEGVTIDGGTFIAPGVVIGPDVKIGKNVIINTGSIVDHDCHISDFVHIGPGVILNGSVKVSEKTHIGTGASIIQQRKIGHSTIIGAGSVVVTDIPPNSKAFGNPCKVVNKF